MILFLDFDGVLHPEPSLAKDAFCRLPLIEEILQDFPQVQIVVSSAWPPGLGHRGRGCRWSVGSLFSFPSRPPGRGHT